MKYIVLILVCLLCGGAHAGESRQQTYTVDSCWQVPFASADALLEARNTCRTASQVWDDCCFLWACGEYVLAHPDRKDDTAKLLAQLPAVDWNHPAALEFMEQQDAARFLDHIYMFRALKDGSEFDAARDGLQIYTQFPARQPNRNDFAKLEAVFSGSVSRLHEAYLPRLAFLFRNKGCMAAMRPLRKLIETNVADSPSKQKVLALYDTYEALAEGREAPLSVLKDASGQEHTFAEFKGKVVVVDVWATWCCSCLEKMPKFIRMKDEFARQTDGVVFLTVSIDRARSKQAWLAAIAKHGMDGMANWMPDSPTASAFEHDYQIDSVPRYLVIDRDGRIVSAFAPGPGEELEQLILNTLKRNSQQ